MPFQITWSLFPFSNKNLQSFQKCYKIFILSKDLHTLFRVCLYPNQCISELKQNIGTAINRWKTWIWKVLTYHMITNIYIYQQNYSKFAYKKNKYFTVFTWKFIFMKVQFIILIGTIIQKFRLTQLFLHMVYARYLSFC